MNDNTAMVAMSGGVDSSVAAYLAMQQGLHCCGGTMSLLPGMSGETEDAALIARRLGIPFYAFDFTREFQDLVMEPFVQSYEKGDTPNPCIRCNRFLKFGLLLREARALNCRYLITGHYARVLQDPETGRFLLMKAADRAKDQTYFLCSLTQDQLSAIRFPLGALTKAQVRQIAQTQGFINARKRDSQDICFVPDGDYMNFLRQFRKQDYPGGDFLDSAGRVIGRHHGTVAYTLGQRKGLGLSLGAPAYVCGKDMAANTVTVGPDRALYSRTLLAEDLNWFPFAAPDRPIRVLAKTRSRMTEQPATVYPMESGIRLVFDEPQRAITAGQAVVMYQGEYVVGGGTIVSAESPAD